MMKVSGVSKAAAGKLPVMIFSQTVIYGRVAIDTDP
jgi:hypothetical protein